MLDSWGIVVALSGWAAWLSKEIITRLLDHRLARTGRIDVVEGHTRIMCNTTSRDGNTYLVDYHPRMATLAQYADCNRFRIILDTQFSNDTDTQVVFTRFDLEYWGVEGLRLMSSDQRPLVPAHAPDTWQSTASVSVPAHSVVGVRFEVLVGSTFAQTEEAIRDYYGETVVLLRSQSIDGKKAAFRLCTHSFAGANAIVWLHDKTYPVFSKRGLNQGGWKAGRRPQCRTGNETAMEQAHGNGPP